MLILKKGNNMPRFDGTGPDGRGPITGRGMGNCAEGAGRFGRRGRGMGFGRRFHPDCPFAEEGKNGLEEYKKELEKELEVVKDELKK